MTWGRISPAMCDHLPRNTPSSVLWIYSPCCTFFFSRVVWINLKRDGFLTIRALYKLQQYKLGIILGGSIIWKTHRSKLLHMLLVCTQFIYNWFTSEEKWLPRVGLSWIYIPRDDHLSYGIGSWDYPNIERGKQNKYPFPG